MCYSRSEHFVSKSTCDINNIAVHLYPACQNAVVNSSLLHIRAILLVCGDRRVSAGHDIWSNLLSQSFLSGDVIVA
jgi:hypothetical protein